MGYTEWLNFARIPRHLKGGIPANFIIWGASCTTLYVGNIPEVRWHLLYENDNDK